ncbi:MAG: ribbon-helix-helix domain-containing protein [Thermomicrobiales bacterium]
MSVTLSPQIEAAIRRKVERGLYASTDEAVATAFHLLDEHDRHALLKAALAVGQAQIARGEGIELTPELWDDIEREADEADRQGLPLNPDVCP